MNLVDRIIYFIIAHKVYKNFVTLVEFYFVVF